MPKLTTAIDTHSSEFAENALAMQAQAQALKEKLEHIHRGGGELAR